MTHDSWLSRSSASSCRPALFWAAEVLDKCTAFWPLSTWIPFKWFNMVRSIRTIWTFPAFTCQLCHSVCLGLRVNQVFPLTRISVCWFLHSKFHCFQNAKVQCNLETASLAMPSAKLICRCPTVPTPVNSCGARWQGNGSFHNKARLVSMAFWDSSIFLGTDEHSFQPKH